MQPLVRNIFFGKFIFSSYFLNRKEAGVSRGKNTQIQISTVLFTVDKQREGKAAIYFAENTQEDASKTQHWLVQADVISFWRYK